MSSTCRYDTEDLSQRYRTFTQSYPSALVDKVIAFHDSHHNSKKLALDVACGTGLCTAAFAPYFDRVIGVDSSAFQLEKADRRFDNVIYSVGTAEDLSFQPDDSVDLLLIAAALHLVDIDKFYKEVVRVLKPGGTLAVCDHDLPSLPPAEATATMNEFYKRLMSRTYTKRQLGLLRGSFKDEILPFPGQIREEVLVKRKGPLSNLMGYITILSFYQDLVKTDPSSTELQDLQSKLCSIINGENVTELSEDPTVEIDWLYFALLVTKPQR